MSIDKFIKGLTILRLYFDEDGHEMGSEHDIFYVYKTARPLARQHLDQMEELGWFQEDVDTGDDDDDEWMAKHYDASEGWCAYV